MLGWLLGHVLEVTGEGRSLGGCELPTPLEQKVPGRERCDRLYTFDMKDVQSIMHNIYTFTVTIILSMQ